ncbi:MAG: YbaB/EbfC family nucleoid-associated protein [Candidatus Eisenbacteria bacterium]|nr:YbaB/EbfC family nucleoid-associated protein [Candidatus Eisenbacteria bacterium]
MKNFASIMKQAQKMQEKMNELQAQLETKIVESSAGGGMVKVTANGRQEIVSIKIDPEVVSKDDVEMLEDLILSAVNEARRKADELAKEEMARLTGELGLPGLFK